MQSIVLRRAKASDLEELKQLSVNTVKTVCNKHYNSEQIRVWASAIQDKKRWWNILLNQFVMVANLREKIVGVATLDAGNYLDLMYVHNNHLRKGIATMLYSEIEKEATRLGQRQIYTDVSKSALLFFIKAGYILITEQTVNLSGVELINYKMKKEFL